MLGLVLDCMRFGRFLHADSDFTCNKVKRFATFETQRLK
jgi:hypothetical protein